jgi:MFS family permease
VTRIESSSRFVGTPVNDEPALKEAAAPAAPAEAPAPAAPPAPPAAAPFVPMPRWRAAIYAASSLFLGITQGLGVNLVSSNTTGLQGSFGASAIEMAWPAAAYFATNVTGTLILFKVRNQFGLRRFGEIGLVIYLLVSLAHLFTNDLSSVLFIRAVTGFVAAPLSTLAFFYMLEWVPPAKKMSIGICFGMLGGNLALPVARIISPELLQLGDWHGLYLLEAGMAAISFAIVFTLPLTHPPRIKMFDRDDWISMPLLAVMFGSFAIVLSLGKTYWWFETPWLGMLTAVGLVALIGLFVVEFHRENPIIDLRWLGTGEMIRFALVLLTFRILLSEQSTGMVNFFTVLGMQNDQLAPLFAVIGISTFVTTAILSQVIKPERTPAIHLIALAMIAAAAWMDSQSTVLTRPEQFFLSQALMGSASALFLPPSMVTGFGKALRKGPRYILSFMTVFISTQTVGGMIGSAIWSTFQTLREQFHSNVIAEHMTLVDPNVAARVTTYAGVYAKTLVDPALRNAEGVVMLGQAATQQANVLAYDDVFTVIFWLTLATMAVLLGRAVIAEWSAKLAPKAPQAA